MNRIILAICFVASSIIGQKLNFLQIGPEKGLDISQIIKLVKLENNIIVAGTLGGGIYFFNGSEFINMGIESGLANNKVLNMAIGQDGRLWIATRFGISMYDGIKFSNYNTSNGLSNNIVNCLFVAKNGSVYAGTQSGLDIFRPDESGGKFENLYKGKRVFGLYEDEKESLWVGTGRGLIILSDGTRDSTRYKELVSEPINNIRAWPDNRIAVCAENGLFIVNDTGMEKLHRKFDLVSNYVNDVLVTSTGDIWIATDRGLSRLSGERLRNYGEKEGINNYMVWTMLEDQEKNIWFGTDEGLYKLSPDEFEIFLDPDGNKIDAWYVKRDRWGTLWAGIHQKGLYRMEEGKFVPVRGIPFLEGKSIDYIYQGHSNNLWFCGLYGVARYNGSRIEKFLPQSELSELEVNSVVENKTGDTWFGTWESRLYKYSNGKLNFEWQGESPLVYMEDFGGSIHIATPGGLYVIGNEGPVVPKWAEPFRKHDIVSLQTYSDKQLLLAIYNLGVIVANFGDSGSVALDTISADDGLNDNSILAMAIDGNSDLWVGTNKGINRVTLSSYKSRGTIVINSFGYDDGIPGSELLQKSMYYDPVEGHMWFGTITGLARFSPSDFRERTSNADIQFTSFNYTDGNKRHYVNPNYLKDRFITDSEIQIPISESDISVSFAATHFRSPSSVKYRYKINDGPWSGFSKQKDIILPNLIHGSYNLTVEAECAWNTTIESANLQFVIPTPFQDTIWFKLFLGIAAVAVLFWAYRLRTAKSRERQNELEERLKEREQYQEALKKQYQVAKIQKEKAEESDRVKSEFLAQVSHEIRTPLSVILNYTSMMSEKLKDESDLKDSFSSIENSGRRLTRTIDSILNMSQLQAGTLETNPKMMDLSVIVKKIVDEFQTLADSKRIELRMKINNDNTSAVIDEYTVSHMLQNLIDNAIKYTDKGFVQVNLDRNSSDRLTLGIKDSGVGIAEDYLPELFLPFTQEESGYTRKFDGAGLGLSLVKKYCELNSAEITVESEKEFGTTFTVTFNS